jgi:hypothetical protein
MQEDLGRLLDKLRELRAAMRAPEAEVGAHD